MLDTVTCHLHKIKSLSLSLNENVETNKIHVYQRMDPL